MDGSVRVGGGKAVCDGLMLMGAITLRQCLNRIEDFPILGDPNPQAVRLPAAPESFDDVHTMLAKYILNLITRYTPKLKRYARVMHKAIWGYTVPAAEKAIRTTYDETSCTGS
jgi:hypothetical protein